MRRTNEPSRPTPSTLLAGAFLAAAVLTAGVAGAEATGDGDGYRASYLEEARARADANRYLVKPLVDLDQIGQPADPADPVLDGPPYYVSLADNMEPRMVHCRQIEASWEKLAAGGYCVDRPAAEILRACPNLADFAFDAEGCKRPNILVFLVDDMGWSDFGPYGGGVAKGAATPNVNRLANEGLLLTSTYAQPSCSPTRATLHTGQLPIHHGVLSPPMYGAPGGLTAESLPLPLLLKKRGYTTHGVGKWHLGDAEKNLPTALGYDEYFGFLVVSDVYTEWRDHYYNPEVAWDEERTRFMQENPFNHYLIHSRASADGRRLPLDDQCKSLAEIVLPREAAEARAAAAAGKPVPPTQGFTGPCPKAPSGHPLGERYDPETARVSISDLDQLWADDSVRFIHRMAESDEPWFLYHATRGCHFDNYPREDFQRASYARTTYGDCTVEMDEVLGRLLDALEKTGQDRDTLVFFTSDNGPEEEIDPHGHTPFRGAKGDTWEGGVRVPGIVRWAGRGDDGRLTAMVGPGRRSDGLFDLADLYPTILGLAGFDYLAESEQQGSKLADRYLYGIDQGSFLLADEGASNRRSVLYWYLTNFAAVRMDEFKAHRMVSLPVGLDRGNVGGLSGVDLKQSYMWMFNLMKDPQEQNNVFIRHLWNNALFSAEVSRFYCVLTRYEPHLPTNVAANVLIDAQIWLLEHHQELEELAGNKPLPPVCSQGHKRLTGP